MGSSLRAAPHQTVGLLRSVAGVGPFATGLGKASCQPLTLVG